MLLRPQPLTCELVAPDDAETFARRAMRDAVLSGLTATPRTLPCRYFYDRRGSRLFELICEQPEYYLTRAEDEILASRGDELIAELPPGAIELVELGSGNAHKTRRLLEALHVRGRDVIYVPVDIAGEMLERTSARLRRELPRLRVEPIAAEYEPALDLLERRTHGRPRALLFLGSNLGNFDAAAARAFLARVAAALAPGDVAIVGLDRRKDPRVLEAAYDDAAGVTAAFDLNVLRRLNRELGADFELDGFAHRARWNPDTGSVEMHLVSRRAQTVRLAGQRFDFAAGDTIHTESSHKYDDDEVRALFGGAGLALRRTFRDAAERFGLHVFVR